MECNSLIVFDLLDNILAKLRISMISPNYVSTFENYLNFEDFRENQLDTCMKRILHKHVLHLMTD